MSALPLYNSMRCVKCGCPDANSSWVSYDAVKEIDWGTAASAFEEKRDLIERDCIECGYAWWELPLDAPEAANATEDPLTEGNKALRRLIVQICREIPMDVLNKSTYRSVAAVIEGEMGPQSDKEEDIAEAAPYFAPLRRENR